MKERCAPVSNKTRQIVLALPEETRMNPVCRTVLHGLTSSSTFAEEEWLSELAMGRVLGLGFG